jgi:UDP-3-O-[3-hydroxymyristoyl] N-acetylglucosamine deacetylase
LEDLVVKVDGPEMPLGDGSANLWIDLLKSSGIPQKTVSHATHDLGQPICVVKGDRSLVAVPSDRFSVTYLMDWQHPKIGKRWQSWKASDPISQIACARTFASLKEHEMLGLTKDLVSLTADGFTHTLHFEDEPVRHKLLDLIGDLTLIGINPLRLKAHIISVRGGHEMDVLLASKIVAQLS